MTRRSCDGAGLLAAFRAAVANLEANVDEINDLNVFPVPDGDTGSNMFATVRVALEEAEGAAGQPAERIAAAISFGALMGARGNSGVITSQILNGMARGLVRKRRFNGLALGTLSRISVENLDQQARDVRESRASDFTGGPAERVGAEPLLEVSPRATPGQRPAPVVVAAGRTTFAPGALDEPRRPLAVVAVAAGDGLASIFDDFGVAAIVRGGQAANPSTGELLAAVDALNADEVLLLPNNPNVILAARQVAEMARRPVHVVPTRNAAEGFAALLALDPGESAAANVAGMTEAGRGLATLQVTTAVRDAKVSGRKVKKGQTIVLDPDDGLVAADGDRDRAILSAVETLPAGIELVTLFYGDGADLAEAEGVVGRIAEARAGVEVEVRHGGQPHYRYLISAE